MPKPLDITAPLYSFLLAGIKYSSNFDLTISNQYGWDKNIITNIQYPFAKAINLRLWINDELNVYIIVRHYGRQSTFRP